MRLPVLPRSVRQAAALAVAAAILVTSMLPPGPDAGPEFVLFGVAADAWLHALAYAILAGAVAYARLSDGARQLAAVVLLVVAYGLVIEALQAPLPYRTAAPVDALADAAGAVVGAAVWSGIRRAGLRDDPGTTPL